MTLDRLSNVRALNMAGTRMRFKYGLDGGRPIVCTLDCGAYKIVLGVQQTVVLPSSCLIRISATRCTYAQIVVLTYTSQDLR